MVKKCPVKNKKKLNHHPNLCKQLTINYFILSFKMMFLTQNTLHLLLFSLSKQIMLFFLLYFHDRNDLVLKWSRKINKFVCGSEEELIAIIISQLPEQRRSRTNGMSPSSLLYYLSLLSSFCKSSLSAHSFFLAAPENKQELSTEVALLCHGREIYVDIQKKYGGEKQPIMMLSQRTQDRNKIYVLADR